jgi:serine/threonine-protein kinase
MKPERWERIGKIFAAALEQPVEARQRFVAEACEGDGDLEGQVTALLDSEESAGDYFADLADRAGVHAVDDAEPDDLQGKRIGSYRLVQLIGRGGMGAVYLAERDDQQFEMQTALKLLPVGLESEESRLRFLSERQILARLKHPSIAQLLDGGVTEDGTPFFVMEHVEGVPIDEYCDTRRLGIPERLEIFLHVCDAVQHAHQNLIVHRDLKPGNILVTETGEVKLLDFGIARVLAPGEHGDAGLTQTRRARPMTLAYASPEQLRGATVTTASDVYALGILLYRLLTGRHPYELPFASPSDAERVICEEQPPSPSLALRRAKKEAAAEPPPSTSDAEGSAQSRRSSLQKLIRQISGDLDTITMMALRKEPERRYTSVSQFADDIRRYLGGLPVSAQKDTLRYRASRFVRRNRVAVVVAIAFAVMLVGLVGISLRYAVTSAAQSRAVAREAETTEQVSTFLVDLFKMADPVEGFGDTVRVRTVLDRGAEYIEDALQDQPEIRARLLRVLGGVYENLGLYDESVRLYQEALDLQRLVHGESHLEVAEGLHKLAEAERSKRNFEAAESLYVAALDLRRRLNDDPVNISHSLRGLALALRELGAADSAEVLARQALEIRTAELGAEDLLTVTSRLDLAYVLRATGEVDSAEVLYLGAIPILRTHGEPGRRLLGGTFNNLGFLHRSKKQFAEAERWYREALPLERARGREPHLVILLNNLASVLYQQGKYAEAEEALRERLAVSEAHWPPGDWHIGNAHAALGNLFMLIGDTAQAEPFVRQRLAIYEAAFGSDHGWTAQAKVALGSCLAGLNQYTEAEQLLLEGYRSLRDRSGLEDRYTQGALTLLVRLYRAWGREDAERQYQELLEPAR